MKSKNFLLMVAGFVLSNVMAAGIPIPEVSLSPAEQRVADAAKIKDPVEREAALRASIEEGLLRSSRDVRMEVQQYLALNRRWIDPRPFEDIIAQSTDGRSWIQGIRWDYLTRDERLKVVREAIEQGQAVAPGGDIINRAVAMQAVGWYGLEELVPLVRQYYPVLVQQIKHSVPDYIPTKPEVHFTPEQIALRAHLREGGEDLEDCFRRSAERLAAMPDEEFRQKMETEKDFRDVLLGAAGEINRVCERNPFTGWVNSGCEQIHRIYERQATLDKKAQAERAAQGIRTSPPRVGQETWLEGIRRASRYDIRYPEK
ncbi:MAG TPA: hypothetical protein VKH46_11845 [Thermoanaerobaculia bacterium]|nr:hypothetical protein [Thermoanaerobaculia bacterium]